LLPNANAERVSNEAATDAHCIDGAPIWLLSVNRGHLLWDRGEAPTLYIAYLLPNLLARVVGVINVRVGGLREALSIDPAEKASNAAVGKDLPIIALGQDPFC
jgi:hypothetical protein